MRQTIITLALLWSLMNFAITIFGLWKRTRESRSQKAVLNEDKINFKILLINLLREIFEKAMGLSLLGLALSALPSVLTLSKWEWTWTNFIIALLLVDLVYYVTHYINHKVQIFWNQHSVHHNSTAYTLSTGYRVSWIKFLFEWMFYLPLGFLGMPSGMVVLSLLLINNYTHLLHTQKLKSLPWLEYIINTPKAHRIHHSSYEEHIDKNMGGFFIIWDMVFRTFTLSHADKVVYGLTKPLPQNTLGVVNFSEWYKMMECYKNKGLKIFLKALFRDPNKNKEFLT